MTVLFSRFLAVSFMTLLLASNVVVAGHRPFLSARPQVREATTTTTTTVTSKVRVVEEVPMRTVGRVVESPVTRYVERVVEVPVTRYVEVPVTRYVEVPVTRYVEVPVTRYVEEPITRQVEVREIEVPVVRRYAEVPSTRFVPTMREVVILERAITPRRSSHYMR